jgi:3-phenylpropionate/cinnamic acid dioxygenase small subunit
MDVADRLALHELAALYGDTIDNRDWDGLGRVFTDDMVYANPTMPGRDLVGLPLLKTFMSRARHPLTHLISNVRVDEEEDGPVVHSRVLLLRDDGTAQAGEYHDRVVRTDDGWRIRHRTYVARVRPAGDPPAPEPSA